MDKGTTMEGVAEADLRLLLALLNPNQSFLLLGILLPWVSGTTSDQQQNLCLSQAQCWHDMLSATTPHSFAVSFLNFVRAESQSIMAINVEGRNAGNTEDDDDDDDVRPSAAMVLLQENEIKKEQKSTLASNSHHRAFIQDRGLPNKQKKSQASTSAKASEQLFYEDDFPALGSDRKPQKLGGSREKLTRRVNPTAISNPVVDSTFILAKVDHVAPSCGHDRTRTRAPSSGSFKVDIDVLMQRFEKNQKKKQKDAHEKWGKESELPIAKDIPQNPPKELLPTSSAVVESSIEKKDHWNGRHTVATEIDCCDKITLHALSAKNQVLRPSSDKLKAVATVHATLLNSKLVPSLLGELGFLFQLLNMEDDMSINGTMMQRTKNSTYRMITGYCGKECEVDERLFTWKDDCCVYACMIMEQSERILDSVGEHLLSLLMEHPAIVRHAPGLVSRLRRLLACHQAASLHSFKAYKLTNRESANFQQLHVSSLEGCKRQDLLSMPVCLPFEASRDSRNNYKTRESQKIYNNRELCRDQFYAIVREATSVHNAFCLVANAFEGDLRTRFHVSIRSLMTLLLPENYPWFTELFLEQVMQVAAYGETDPVLTDLTRQDPSKLQRLHDRLTEGTRSRSVNFGPKCGGDVGKSKENVLLSPGSSWSKVKTELRTFKSNDLIVPKKNGDQEVETHLVLLNLSPLFLQAYILFLETADSYRLNTQLIWSLKSKISRLSEILPHSQDAADIGSALTHRVLNLKALASLLGYLFFSPGIRALPPVPNTHPLEVGWDAQRSNPPVDLLVELQKAQIKKSMLLALPWILEFLHWIKVDQEALRLPYFRSVFSALHNAYTYSILDPQSPHFGVSSICILSELDSFFDYMDLQLWDMASWSNCSGSSQIESLGNNVDDQINVICELDIMIGVVDARYIQHCCPALMHLRWVLVEAQKKRKQPNKPYSPGPIQGKPVRKITPLPHSKPFQDSTTGMPSFMIEDALTTEDHMKAMLQQAFFKQRPQLQRVVDFIIDTVATNAAHAASSKCVPPVLEAALKKLDLAFADRSKDTGLGLDESERTSQTEAIIENIITFSIEQALIPAMEYMRKYSADRTSEALASLATPNEPCSVLGIAAGITAEATSMASCKKALASISSELRKCITQEMECRHRRNYALLSSSLCGHDGKENKHERENLTDNIFDFKILGEPFGSRNIYASIFAEMVNPDTMHDIPSKENKQLFAMETSEQCINFQPKSCFSKRQLCFRDGKEMIVEDKSLTSIFSGLGDPTPLSLAVRIVQCCSVVEESCAAGVLNDMQRNSVRLHVAAVCTSIEGMLLEVENGLPSCGYDAAVCSSYSSLLININSESCSIPCLDDDTFVAHLSIERGLIRRCIALSLRLCLLCPSEAFGYSLESLEKCSCALASLRLTEKLALSELLTTSEDLLDPSSIGTPGQKNYVNSLEHSANIGDFEKHKKDQLPGNECKVLCAMRAYIGAPMEAIVSMWIALSKCTICDMEFILAEFLVPWRWTQALTCEPWKFSRYWLQAVVHGVVNIVHKLINKAPISQESEKVILSFLNEINNLQSVDSNLHKMVKHIDGSREWKEKIWHLSAWISMELSKF